MCFALVRNHVVHPCRFIFILDDINKPGQSDSFRLRKCSDLDMDSQGRVFGDGPRDRIVHFQQVP